MEKYLLDDINMLEITHRNRLYYGGSQEWFASFFKRMAGCGPTTATNLFIYLAKTDSYFKILYDKEINYTNVLKMMSQVYKKITPGLKGVNTLDIFENGALEYVKPFNITMSTSSLKVVPKRTDELEAKNYLVEHLNNNRPIAFLNLSAGLLTNLSNWHWVLIVGLIVENNKMKAIIFDEGKYKQIDLSLWLRTTDKDGGFVTFIKDDLKV